MVKGHDAPVWSRVCPPDLLLLPALRRHVSAPVTATGASPKHNSSPRGRLYRSREPDRDVGAPENRRLRIAHGVHRLVPPPTLSIAPNHQPGAAWPLACINDMQ